MHDNGFFGGYFGGAAFSFGAGMDERKRVKKPHPKK